MATQYSTLLKLALPVQGELSGAWGDVVNDNVTSMIEEAIAGRAVINTWATNSHTLTTANGTTSESRAAVLELTDSGTALTGAGTVVCPASSKIYLINNTSGQAVTIKTSAGTGVSVPTGDTVLVYCDGTNVISGTGSYLTKASNLSDVASASTSRTNLGVAIGSDVQAYDADTAKLDVVQTWTANQTITGTMDATTVEFNALSGTGAVAVTDIKDEDNMASNSATMLATQQSIKAYVDAQVGTADTLSEVLALGNTSGGTNVEISTTDKVQFRDAAIYINSSVDGQLDIVADNEIQIAATTVDLNGILNVSGNIVAGGTVDGVDIASRDSVLTSTTTTAGAALPKAGGAMTGAITTNSTFDGVDIASRDSVLTSTTTTAGAALPKAGGAMTGAITTNSTFDGRDVSVDGTKLDGIAAGATANVGDITGVTAGTGMSGGGTSGSVTLTNSAPNIVQTTVSGNAGTVTNGVYTTTVQGLITNNTQVLANTAKTGITAAQASAITANTAKVTNATHTGDVTGSTVLTIATDAVDIAMLSASGTAGSSTFLRGDNTWATAGAGDITEVIAGTGMSGGGTSGSVTLTNSSPNVVQTTVSGSAGSFTGSLAGDVAGTQGATVIQVDAVDIAMLSASGTASSTTYLRGDNTWATAGGGIGSFIGTSAAISSDGTALENDDGSSNNNIGIGLRAGRQLVTGANNIALGDEALRNATTSGNIALGQSSLWRNTSGSYNTAVGHNALQGGATYTGSYNIGVGYQAGTGITTGQYNVVSGYRAGYAVTTGNDNVLLGKSAGYRLVTGISNVIIGEAAGFDLAGSENVGLGTRALKGAYGLSTGSYNIGIGYEVGTGLTTGSYNFLGSWWAGYGVTTGQKNNLLGYKAGEYVTTSSSNVAVGTEALRGATSAKLTGSYNTGIGHQAGYAISTGSYNVLNGYTAGYALTTGLYNVYLGREAGKGATTGSANNAMGLLAFGGALGTYTGSYSVAIGHQAALYNQSGTNNTFIGGRSPASDARSGSNLTCLGSYAQPSSGTVSNEVTIGDTSVSRFRIPGIGVDWTSSTLPGGIGSFIDNSIAISSDNTALANDDGTNNKNIGIGKSAGNSITTGFSNVAIGTSSMNRGTVGYANIAIGPTALDKSNNTNYSIAIGYDSLSGASGTGVAGIENTGIGSQTGYNLTSGLKNDLIGYRSGFYLSTGSYNTGVGPEALRGHTTSLLTGMYNVGVGYQTGYNLTTGMYNVFNGYRAGYAVTTGNYNVLSGWSAGIAIDSGSNNIASGYNAGKSISSGEKNIALGNGALSKVTTGQGNIGFGNEVLGEGGASVVTGSYNIGIGHQVGYFMSGAVSYNVLMGYQTATQLTTGANNVFIGKNTGTNNTTGTYNVGVGYQVLNGNTTNKLTGGYNVGMGHQAGYNLTTGQSNVLSGHNAAEYLTTGQSNVIMGTSAGLTLVGGNYNVYIGHYAGGKVSGTDTLGTTAVGYMAGKAGVDASTVIGMNAGLVATGRWNTFIGRYCADSATTGENNICIGNGASLSAASVSNEVTLGDVSIATLRCAVTTITAVSDGRDKANIEDLDAGLDFINTLRPVKFDWDMRDGGKVGAADIGFIAQDLQQAQIDNDLVVPHLVMDGNPDKLEAGYGMLMAPLVKALQELSAKVDAQALEIKTLKSNIGEV